MDLNWPIVHFDRIQVRRRTIVEDWLTRKLCVVYCLSVVADEGSSNDAWVPPSPPKIEPWYKNLGSGEVWLICFWAVLVLAASAIGFLAKCLQGKPLDFFQTGESLLVSLAIVAAGAWEMLRYTKSQNPVREELVNYLTVSLLVIAGAGMVTFWGLAHSAVYVSEHVLYLVACTIWATFLTVQVEIHKCKIRSVAKTVPADNISEVAES